MPGFLSKEFANLHFVRPPAGQNAGLSSEAEQPNREATAGCAASLKFRASK